MLISWGSLKNHVEVDSLPNLISIAGYGGRSPWSGPQTNGTFSGIICCKRSGPRLSLSSGQGMTLPYLNVENGTVVAE